MQLIVFLFPYAAILSWFVHNDIATAAITEGRIVEDEDVEVRPEKVPTACIDENVCLERCRKYCTADAWLVIMDVVTAIRNNPVWYCGRCTSPISDDTQSSLVCECCLGWFCFQCLGIKQPPKAKVWFCRECCATFQGQQ